MPLLSNGHRLSNTTEINISKGLSDKIFFKDTLFKADQRSLREVFADSLPQELDEFSDHTLADIKTINKKQFIASHGKRTHHLLLEYGRRLGPAEYIGKKPRQRTLKAIMGNSLPELLNNFADYTLDDFQHMNEPELRVEYGDETIDLLLQCGEQLYDVLVEAAFGEVLFAKLAKALFPCSLIVPDTYLHLDNDYEFYNLSLYRVFDEFIQVALKEAIGQTVESPQYWQANPRPEQSELEFDAEQKQMLGVLYAVALLFNDWDLINNIMCSNSGSMLNDEDASVACIVDGGNKFQFGFGGQPCAVTTFKNPQMSVSADTDANRYPSTGMMNTLPFDNEVIFALPRQVIDNLFDLSDAHIRQGFKMAIEEAKGTLTTGQLVREAVIEAYTDGISIDSHPKAKKRLMAVIDCDYYTRNSHHSGEQTEQDRQQDNNQKSEPYNLAGILQGRLQSIERGLAAIANGKSFEGINKRRVLRYQYRQIEHTLQGTLDKLSSYGDDLSNQHLIEIFEYQLVCDGSNAINPKLSSPLVDYLLLMMKPINSSIGMTCEVFFNNVNKVASLNMNTEIPKTSVIKYVREWMKFCQQYSSDLTKNRNSSMLFVPEDKEQVADDNKENNPDINTINRVNSNN